MTNVGIITLPVTYLPDFRIITMFRKNEKEKAIDSFLKIEFENADFLFLLICTELPDFNPSVILAPGYTPPSRGVGGGVRR